MLALREVSIRVKLAVLTSAVIVLVVLGQTFESLSNEAVISQEQIALRARVVLVSVAGAFSAAWKSTPPDLAPFDKRISRVLTVRTLALLDPDGHVLASRGRKPSRAEIQRVTVLRLRTTPHSLWGLTLAPLEMVVATPVVRGDAVRGYLLCTFASDEPAQRLRQLIGSALSWAALWVAIGGGLTLWLTNRLARPLVHLADDLNRMRHDEYALPVEGRADGEIGVVQDRLVRLSEHLSHERSRVGELNTALQHQVNVVSADLASVAAERQAILDSVRDAIVLVHSDGTVSSANGPAYRFFGDDIAAPGTSLTSRVKDPAALAQAMQKVRSLGASQMLQTETVGPVGAPRRYLRLRVAPLSGGAAQALVIIAEDISETRQLEEQMLRSERLASIGTLTAGLAHQIGNHLNGIKGYAVLLTRRLEEADAQTREDLAGINKEVRAAAELMDRVLILARTRPPVDAPVDVSTIVDEVLSLVAVPARHQSVVIQTELPARGCVVQGDPQLLIQALLNIVMNALQAMPEGGELHIASGCSDDGHCEVAIRDTGGGMSPEVMRRIFDPFFTTKPEGQGTGLGLAIAHRIVELHGGGIRVASTPGEGTTFTVDLPVLEPAREEAS